MKKIKFRKKFWLQIFLPVTIAIGIFLGCTVGITYVVRNKHNYPQNLTINLENPKFGSSSPNDLKFKFNSKKFNKDEYIEYWTTTSHMMVPYTVDYSKTFREFNDSAKTLGDFVDEWNLDSGLNNKLFKVSKKTTLYGRALERYLNPHITNTNNEYLPTKQQLSNSYLKFTSTTNANSKKMRHAPGKFDPYSLDYQTTKGIDELYLETSDTINIINWPWK